MLEFFFLYDSLRDTGFNHLYVVNYLSWYIVVTSIQWGPLFMYTVTLTLYAVLLSLSMPLSLLSEYQIDVLSDWMKSWATCHLSAVQEAYRNVRSISDPSPSN